MMFESAMKVPFSDFRLVRGPIAPWKWSVFRRRHLVRLWLLIGLAHEGAGFMVFFAHTFRLSRMRRSLQT